PCSPSYPPDEKGQRPYERYGGDPYPASLGTPDLDGWAEQQISPGGHGARDQERDQRKRNAPFDGLRIHRATLPGATLGRERGDIFEITVITLVWVVLLI